MRIKPNIWIPNEPPDRMLAGTLFERYEHFDIYWYHWPNDGFFRVEDYEPIILVYSDDDELCYLIVRRGWEYKHYAAETLYYPLEVSFEGSFHHPFARILDDKEYEMSKGVNKLVDIGNYNPDKIDSSAIPAMFRTGEGHPTLAKRLWIPVQDPFDEAEETYNEYCV